MVINIWNSNETLAAVVDDFLVANHSEEINNENILKASLPIKNKHISLLKEGNYLGFVDADEDYQMFEILEVIENHEACSVYAEHVSCELKSEIVEDVRPYNQTAETALNGALANTRWVTGTVADFGLKSTNFYFESARSCIAKIINTWGGEIKYRLVFDGNTITQRYIDLIESRGNDTGKRFEYGKDIIDIERQVSLESVITACYGRGKGEELEGEDGQSSFGRRITFENEVWEMPNNPADKPMGQKWVGDNNAKALYGYSNRHRFGVFLDDNEADSSILLEKTWDYLQQNNKPRVTYDMNILLLESLSGFAHEKVRLGDVVVVKDKELDITVKARIIKIENDLLTPALSKVRLGNFIDSFSNKFTETVKFVDDYRDRQGFYDDGSTRAKDGLTESGYINLPIHGQKIVGTDAEDGLNLTNTHMGYYNDAQSAWRAYIDNTGNFLFQKDANSYFMYDGTNFTFRGPLVADDITSGKVQSADGSTYFDLDNAEIQITATIDSVPAVITMNPTEGFSIYDGTTYRGGLKIVNGKVSLVSDVLANASNLKQFVDYELVYGDTIYGMAFYTPDEQNVSKRAMGIFTYVSSQNRASHILSLGETKACSLALGAISDLSDSPTNCAKIDLFGNDPTYSSFVDIYSLDKLGNGMGISVNPTSIKMKADYQTLVDLNRNGDMSVVGTLTMGNASKIKGSGTGNSNTAYLQFMESNNTTRQGYIGYGHTGNSNMTISNEIGDIHLRPNSGGNVLLNNANIVGSTADDGTWITCRRIGCGVNANSTYTIDAGTGYIHANRLYVDYGLYVNNQLGASRDFEVRGADGMSYKMMFTGGLLTDIR